MLYYLHIAGTPEQDCKWMFSDLDTLQSFIDSLPLTKIVIIKFREKENTEGGVFEREQELLEGEKALTYWENHITILKFDEKTFPSFRKFYRAPYWEERKDSKSYGKTH